MPELDGPRLKSVAALIFVALLFAAGALAAQEAPEGGAEGRAAREAELEAIVRDIAVTEGRLAELRREIDALDNDSATLNQSLIDTSARVQALETAIAATEARMQGLAASEAALRSSLLERRDVLAEVLAALQRMGHRPPPAILVRPEDALASVRSAILLGAVVPDLRAAADRLASDLRGLVALRDEMATERDRMIADATSLADERARVELLIEEKRNRRLASAAALTDEEQRAAVLAAEATNLKDLIATMEKEIAAAAEAKAAAEKAAAANRKAAQESGRAKPTSLGAADRLAPAVSFADARGLLPLPVSGRRTLKFGDTDILGARSEGISIATRPAAQVTAPSDGWVVYAGPFRSYGQLLIINAGDGYHVLLAGMDRIEVQLGQFILAGEPVAMMAAPKLASAGAVDMASAQPILYIEFRKDGTSIDPAPWWAS
jgi:murein hydrolase activator